MKSKHFRLALNLALDSDFGTKSGTRIFPPSNVQFFKNRLLHSKNFGGQFHETTYYSRKAFSVAKIEFNK